MEPTNKPSKWPFVSHVIANILMGFLALVCLIAAFPLGLVLVACIVLYNIGVSKANKAQKLQQETAQNELRALQAKLDTLSCYQTVADVDAEAKKLKAEAQAEAERITAIATETAETIKTTAQASANQIKTEAQKEAADLLSEAKANNQSTREKLASAATEAGRQLDSAGEEARRIIADAQAKAEAIAGEAYHIKNSVDELRQTEIAIRNSINGYGDEWLKPTYSLLDELAEEFSYEDAGKKLKDARTFSAHMISSGAAATCDYVENNRKINAIRFVIDAFNGKVDSILSKTRQDNYGKLERQIQDAYHMVNANGQAFRNARITPEYLEARLQELKWAVIVFELRKKQQEEQRQIREQMREEAKARREYERAQKAAAKEEAMLKKAMEKAQAMLAQANAEKRAEFESQLAELEQKLKEAEEKGQRAMSMAQQTRHGNVYIISNIGSFGENVYKVGMTRRLNPLDRVRELGDASVPFSFDVHAIIESDDAPALEHTLHQELAMMQVNKVNPRKEFFRVALSDIRTLVEKHGLDVKWTMVAEAAEFRETQSIEERMKNDPDAMRQWSDFYERLGRELPEDDEDS